MDTSWTVAAGQWPVDDTMMMAHPGFFGETLELADSTIRIFDTLSEGILIVDKEGIVIYVNPAYSQITNVPYDTIVGQPLIKIRPGSRLTSVVKTGRAIFRAPRFFENVAYMTNMCPIRNDAGEVVGGISTVIEAQGVYELNKELERFQREVRKLENFIRREKTAKYTFDQIISADPASVETIDLAKRMARKELCILITGGSGTGKELYANSIHNESLRREGPFVALNCATFDQSLLESELFGYEEGAFTGAKKGGKPGLFEVANGGTLFLDEISELDYQIQARLLRVLQENTVRHVGGNKEIQVDVRIIAASNKNLEELVAKKLFREDLYYRINVIPLSLPTLKQRRGDIIPLANHFLNTIIQEEKTPLELAPETLQVLLNYDWPGNIRELKNTVQFAAFLTDNHVILPTHLPPKIQAECTRKNLIRLPNLKERMRGFERKEIKQALLIYGDSVEGKRQAAEHLGISLATLYNKMEA